MFIFTQDPSTLDGEGEVQVSSCRFYIQLNSAGLLLLHTSGQRCCRQWCMVLIYRIVFVWIQIKFVHVFIGLYVNCSALYVGKGEWQSNSIASSFYICFSMYGVLNHKHRAKFILRINSTSKSSH